LLSLLIFLNYMFHEEWHLLGCDAMTDVLTIVLLRATQRHTPEDSILHSDHHENLKFYIYVPCLGHFPVIACSKFNIKTNNTKQAS
jgi:hypothetical protein